MGGSRGSDETLQVLVGGIVVTGKEMLYLTEGCGLAEDGWLEKLFVLFEVLYIGVWVGIAGILGAQADDHLGGKANGPLIYISHRQSLRCYASNTFMYSNCLSNLGLQILNLDYNTTNVMSLIIPTRLPLSPPQNTGKLQYSWGWQTNISYT